MENNEEVKLPETEINAGNEGNESKVLMCPVCGEPLMYMMPDGHTLYCRTCNKYFINDNGSVGEETSYPYTEKDALY